MIELDLKSQEKPKLVVVKRVKPKKCTVEAGNEQSESKRR